MEYSLIGNELLEWFSLQSQPLGCWSDPTGDFHRLTRVWGRGWEFEGWQAALKGEEDGLSCLSVTRSFNHPPPPSPTLIVTLVILISHSPPHGSTFVASGKTLALYWDHWFDALTQGCIATTVNSSNKKKLWPVYVSWITPKYFTPWKSESLNYRCVMC